MFNFSPFGRRRLLVTALGCLVILVPAIFYKEVLEHIAARLVHEDSPAVSDMILIEVWNQPSVDTLRTAAELIARGYSHRVAVTRYIQNDRLARAGLTLPRRYDEIVDIFLEEVGLDPRSVERIPINPEDPITLNLVKQFAEYARHAGIKSVIVVTEPYHSRRSFMAYSQALAGSVRVKVYPSASGLQVSNWWKTKDGIFEVFQESLKLEYYRIFYF